MKLSKAITLFIKDVELRRSRATATAYESDLTRFKFHVQLDTVLHVTPESIQRFLAASSAEGNGMATLHRKLATLRSFGRWGVKHGIWTRNPAETIDSIAKPKTLPRPFSDDEVASIMALVLEPREAIVRQLLLYTGLRVTPICTIKVGDVKWNPPTITALVKGAKHQVVKLHPELIEPLRKFIAEETDRKAHTFILATRDRHPHRRDIERMTHRWGERAGVTDCTPHRFRHSFATRLLRTVGDLRLVQKAMGHEDISSTAIYTLVTDDNEADAIARLRWQT